MTVTISKWGNSQGFRFPKAVMQALNLHIGDKVKFYLQDDRMIIEPLPKQKKTYDINELVKQIPSDYKPEETFDTQSGREIW